MSDSVDCGQTVLAPGEVRRRRGQSLVEFAFVVTVFLLLAMTTVDLGRGILYYNQLANAVREGARYGVITSNSLPNVCNTVRARMLLPATAGCGNSSNLNVTATRCIPNDPNINSSKEAGTAIRVTASYQFTVITPMIALAIGNNSITLNAKSLMYAEDWGTPPITTANSGACPP